MTNPIIVYQGTSIFFDAYQIGTLTTSDHRYAQQFTAVADYTITKISISLGAGWDIVPATTVYLSIQGTNEDDKPDGNVLASASAVITLGYNEDKQLDFAISLAVTFEQKYYIVVYAVIEGYELELRGYAYSDGLGVRASNDGGSTWSVKSSGTMGGHLYGEILPPVVTTDSAGYELYYGWEGWESIKWAVTLVQRIVRTNKELGVCYSKTNQIPTIADGKKTYDEYYPDGTSLVDKWILLATPGTYYVRAICYYLGTYNPATYPDLVGYGEVIEVVIPGVAVINIGAVNSSVYARTVLTGEISGIVETVIIVERGFEYKIQESEPGAEDTGTEVKETSPGFTNGEFSLRDKTLYDQQYIADNIVWWFRAYCKDDEGSKTVADSWMKNLPTVTTQDMTSINYNKADGNGTIIDQGASDLTERGFEVIHEYSGSFRDSWRFEIAGFEGELEEVAVYDSNGIFIIDYLRAGTLIKTVLETVGLDIGAFIITIGQMIWGWPVMDDCLIEGKAYKCRAFASNEFGTVYGDEVDFSTLARTYLAEDPPTTGLTIVKNEIIENLPVGITASRRGFRYGTSESADEFDVHENGSFTNGPYSMMLVDLLPNTTYYVIAYVIVDGITYEGELETITTDPEGEEDEDEYPTPHFSPHGQDYREVNTKVFAEVLASQGIIDFSGGKKTLPITNHLIQTNPNAKVIADDYLSRFKLAKTRMEVTFPTPLPFEREDTIDFSFGSLLFKEDNEGIINFKEDGEGVAVLMDQISMIIKKINSVGLTKTPVSVDYTAVLDLEHE